MQPFSSYTKSSHWPAAASVFISLCATAFGQAPAPPPFQTPKPHYVSIPMEVMVNRPAEEVWRRVGKYCDIQEWINLACVIASGKEGEVGAVRSLNNGAILEVIVGKTALSYTYTQPVREGQQYNLYHGTLEAVPVSATTSKMVYTLLFDNSMLADDAAREKDIQQRTTTFTRAINNMKILAEGGTLPPPPARGRGR
jgi:hypothetical protein